MRLAGIKTIEEANRFLISYARQHNKSFSVLASSEKNAFLASPEKKLLRFILCTRESRKITGDSSISWHGKKYIIEEKRGGQRLFKRGTSVTVLTTMDGHLAVRYQDEILGLKELPAEIKVKEVMATEKDKRARPVNKPAADYPWRRAVITKNPTFPPTSATA